MKQRQRRAANLVKRRTTLTLPADSLTQAARIARSRKVNLSTVISEALSEGLRMHRAAERSEEVLNAYRKAFTGFSDEEMLVLDGVLLDSIAERN
ncbi:MAG TPA: type II toxin-antitoxin system CcdA family antitoxin [Bryobacteraceae bacterium]|jgi:post-segregation antitoxin (ccd killing protein)